MVLGTESLSLRLEAWTEQCLGLVEPTALAEQ
jgi:hypothetical protein